MIAFNVKAETIKLLEENRRENLRGLSYSKDFLNTTQKAWTIKNTNTQNFIKI